jgi:hypothetical protein
MNKTIIVDDQTIAFSLIGQKSDCWHAKATIDYVDTEIDINPSYHRGEVDWDHFQSFFKYVNEAWVFSLLVEDSLPLVTALGKAFGRRYLNEIADWKMELSGVYYNGRPGHNSVYDYAYSLIFDFCVRSGDLIDGDAYGYYLVDVEDSRIMGVRRLQR